METVGGLSAAAGVAAVEALVAGPVTDHNHSAIIAGRRVGLRVEGEEVRLIFGRLRGNDCF